MGSISFPGFKNIFTYSDEKGIEVGVTCIHWGPRVFPYSALLIKSWYHELHWWLYSTWQASTSGSHVSVIGGASKWRLCLGPGIEISLGSPQVLPTDSAWTLSTLITWLCAMKWLQQQWQAAGRGRALGQKQRAGRKGESRKGTRQVEVYSSRALQGRTCILFACFKELKQCGN